ncbi:MAG TPA: glycoside hydrolase family 38 C-terminal domain-containing protein [Ilumatobacteraceae bacterium]|nr:glycoside hydrolase family 38 C-terminal domain-containing protein [Ilumatobacteraceae bacterium]
MHANRDLIEKRIQRELWERVLPLAHPDARPLTIEAGADLDHLEPFTPRTKWGAPWATTWFRFTGEIPTDWAGRRVEAVIDLGFHPDAAGFQCEGLLVDVGDDGSFAPLQGIHPRRTNYAVDAVPGPIVLHLEAASNPTFAGYQPSRFGLVETAGERPLYTFRQATLVVVDPDARALAWDIEVLDGVMRALATDDPRRARLARTLADALDRVPDVAGARKVLAPALEEDFGDAVRHRSVAIGHAHIDTAWLWPLRETVRKCTRTFASAVAMMDDYPDYKFCASSAQHYTWIEERHPELFAKITERVERGQWIPVGGMWVESDMNLPSGESLVRQIVFGQRYFEEKFGRRCTEVWIPDVFGYPAGLPQLFAAGGMHRFVTQKLSWNKQNVFPHSTFWWEGLDGTRVLTHFPPVDTYNAEITPGEFSFSVTNFKEHGWSTDSLMPFGHGDGGGGPTREMVERARRLAHIDARATLEIDTPSAMFARIERDAATGAPVPVWRGELYFEMHRGTLTSQLNTKLGNRRCERLLVEAELWAATLGRRADVDELWKRVLTQQFHDILPGSSIAWVHEDAERILAEVEADVETRIAALLDELAGGGTVVANRSDAAVDEVVVLGVGDVALDAPTQRLADGTTALRVAAPALAVASLRALAVDDRVVLTDTSMANGHLAVRWDHHGNITSIIDLARAREIVPTGSVAAALELAVDHPVEYDAWDVEAWTVAGGVPLTGGDDVTVTVVDAGPLVGRVRVERAFGPSTSVVTYELRAGSAQLTVHVELDWHHDEHLLSMSFPLDVRAETATCDVQFGVVSRPTHPSSPWDAAKFEVCAHRFVDVAEPDYGVAILNDGRFGHGVFDGRVRVSLARAAQYPDPLADRGRHEVTLALLPHGAGLGDVRAAASRLNQPLRVVGSGPVDPSSPTRSVVSVASEPAGVEVDAVKLADDGSGDLIVRLHEACGNRSRVSIVPADRVVAAWRCNLLEEPEAGEEVGDGIVALTVRPFGIVTLRLRRSATPDGRSLTL